MDMLVALLLAAAPAAAPSVTIPLDEYEALRKLRERPSLTVVDQLSVLGSFARRDLAIDLRGRTSGTQPSAGVLTGEGFRLYACQGDALLSRGEAGEFVLTPLAQRFQLRCRVALDGSDRLAAEATAAVLEVTSAVGDGELVRGEGGRSFSIVRRIEGDGGEALPPSVTGRYRVTLLPDESVFLYRLEVRNPGRRHRRFEVALRAAEHVESVNAPVAWDADGSRYRFDLPPGETAIELSGRLTGTSFVPPVEASLQYLLLESHPLIRPDVRASAKRVGVGEVGLPALHRGAQAFLLDGAAEVAWTAARLEALKTAGFAVADLTQVFFLGADGKARGETTLIIENQGAPALTLPMRGDPTFASVQGEPVFLTRDADGQLFLPLGQGRQQVLTQEVRPFAARLGFAFARLELPRTGVAASRAGLELRYPREWIPIYDSLAPTGRLHLLRPSDLVAIAIVLVLFERLLALGGVGRRRRLVLAASVGLVAALAPEARPVLLAAGAVPFVVLAAAIAWRQLSGWRRTAVFASGAVALVVAALALAAAGLVRESDESGFGSPAYSSNLVGKVGYMSNGDVDSFAAREKERRADAGRGYEGLPAKIEIPRGARRSHFVREMVGADAAVPVTLILVATRTASAAAWAAVVLALGIAFRLRRELGEAAQRFVTRVRGERSTGLEPSAPAPVA